MVFGKCIDWVGTGLLSIASLALSGCLFEPPIVEDRCGMDGLIFSTVRLNDLSGNNAKLFNYGAEITTSTFDDESSGFPQINSYADLDERRVMLTGEEKDLELPDSRCTSRYENTLAYSYYFVVAQDNDQLNFFAGWPEQYQALNNVDEYGFFWVDPGGTYDAPANASIPTSIEFVVSETGEVSMVVE